MKRMIDVTTLNQCAKEILQQSSLLDDIVVCGEVTNFTRHYKSGHCYFTLQDSRSSVKAVMFSRQAKLLGFAPEDGMMVLAFGNATLYERDGVFQLYVDFMRPYGVGAAQKAFDQLKEKLGREGLFDACFKKQLPPIPQCLGVVTSKTGAALQDILNVTARRWPAAKLLLAPVNVQGMSAEADIAAGIRALDADRRPDIIIVARGGGSREDLWVFNSELIARAAFACKTPLVSAVGHEIDYTILDYVADLRAPTPSAAAELCVPDREEWAYNIQNIHKNMQNILQNRLQLCYNKLDSVSVPQIQGHIQASLSEKSGHLQEVRSEITEREAVLVRDRQRDLQRCAALAASLSPYQVLARGYAMVRQGGSYVAVDQLEAGASIMLTGARAQAECTVNTVIQEENPDETTEKL